MNLDVANFDLVIVGGGINGAAIARDCALRGLRPLLLEARDFACGASGANGRMIHGGLRYLETADFRLVREALAERSILLKIAPHLVRRSKLVIPIRKNEGRPYLMVRLGLLMLDIMGRGRLPRHQTLNRRQVLERIPALTPDGLQCAAVMHDAFSEFSERLTIENLIDAELNGAIVKNYSLVRSIKRDADQSLRVSWSDRLGKSFSVKVPLVVNTTGAWAADFLSEAADDDSVTVTKAQGTFIVADRFEGAPDEAVFFESLSDKRPIILTPWNGLILIGTTDQVMEGKVDDARASQFEIDYLVQSVNATFAGANFANDNILYTYTGVRPLPQHGGKSHKISRKHLVKMHTGRLSGVITVLGGKLSTFRSLAEEVTDRVFGSLGRLSPPVQTAGQLLPGAKPQNASLSQYPDDSVSDKTRARLSGLYGTRAIEVLKLAREEELTDVIDEASGAIAAEIVFAVRNEWAQTLEDILLRRTILGRNKHQGMNVLNAFRVIAGKHLEWSKEQIEREVAAYTAHAEQAAFFTPDSANSPADEIPEPIENRDLS